MDLAEALREAAIGPAGPPPTGEIQRIARARARTRRAVIRVVPVAALLLVGAVAVVAVGSRGDDTTTTADATTATTSTTSSSTTGPPGDSEVVPPPSLAGGHLVLASRQGFTVESSTEPIDDGTGVVTRELVAARDGDRVRIRVVSSDGAAGVVGAALQGLATRRVPIRATDAQLAQRDDGTSVLAWLENEFVAVVVEFDSNVALSDITALADGLGSEAAPTGQPGVVQPAP